MKVLCLVVLLLYGIPFSYCENKEVNILFVLDASGSMRDLVSGKTKMEVAKETLITLLPDFEKQGFKLGLMVFGHRVGDCNDIELAVDLSTNSRSSIELFLQKIHPKGSTPLANSLQKAGDVLLLLRQQQKQIILLSDGEETCNGHPIAVAKKLRKIGVNLKIHVIGFDVSNRVANLLKNIADEGGGEFYQAQSAKQLLEAFEEVKEKIEADVLGAAKKEEEVEIGDFYFDDSFQRDELGNDWQILDEDPDRWIMDDGVLVISQLPKKITDPQTKQQRYAYYNTLQLNKSLPKNFEITVEWEVPFTLPPTDIYDYGQHLRIYAGTESTGLEVGCGQKGPEIRHFFRKWTRGKENTLLEKKPGLKQSNPLQKIRLRLIKNKFTFKAYAQRSGETWIEIGTHKVLKLKNPHLKIYQENGFLAKSRGDTPEVAIHVKRVSIREIK